MTRLEIYNRMKELGMKHYIVAICHITEEGKKSWYTETDFHKCHYTDEEFDNEIDRLVRNGYNFFDVIHLH